MKKFNGYEETQAYRGFEKLPEGGYVTKIQNVKYMEGKNGNSDMIILAFDVIEGEYKDYFKNQFESQTGEDKNGKVHLLFIAQKMMAAKKTDGRREALRPSWKTLKHLILDMHGTGMKIH